MKLATSLRAAIVLVGLVTLTSSFMQAYARSLVQEAPDWTLVEQELGQTGQLMPGDVFRVGLPRTDLQVTVHGVAVAPTFALGSYAAFKNLGGETMVMGDLVLLDEELYPVMAGLFAGGLSITALHNHLNQVAPHVMYLHFMGHGDAIALAAALRDALSASGTPYGSSPPAPSPAISLDRDQIEAILGRSGRLLDGGVVQVSIPRAETITEMGIELLPAMGIATVLNFQPTGEGNAAITGDFALLGSEVNSVARTLEAYGITVEAVHQHGLGDEPRLFYLHFWANDEVGWLAEGLRAAVDQTNSAPS